MDIPWRRVATESVRVVLSDLELRLAFKGNPSSNHYTHIIVFEFVAVPPHMNY